MSGSVSDTVISDPAVVEPAFVDTAASRDAARGCLTVLLDEGRDDLAASLIEACRTDGVVLPVPELAATRT